MLILYIINQFCLLKVNKLLLSQRMLPMWSWAPFSSDLYSPLGQVLHFSLSIPAFKNGITGRFGQKRKAGCPHPAVLLLPTLPTKAAGCDANNWSSFHRATKPSFWAPHSSWFVSHSYSSLMWNNSKFPGDLDTCPQVFLCQQHSNE